MNQQYFKLLRKLWQEPDAVSKPRGMQVRELLGASFKLDSGKFPLVTIPGFETNIEYAQKELGWYLSGSNLISDLGNFKKCWAFFSDDGVHVNSAYGHRIFGKHSKMENQWRWCLRKLKADTDSRQAVINLNSEFDKRKKTKDFVCTVFCQALIRRKKLYWFTCMRSSDVYLGIRNDVFCFTAMQRIMAHQLGVGVGKYIHFASSLHLYEKQYQKVRTLLQAHDSPRDFKDVYYSDEDLKIKDLLKKYSKNLGGDKNWKIKT